MGGQPRGGELQASDLEQVARTRVFFAHRSVGASIVEQGVPAVYARFGLPSPTSGAGLPLAGGSLADEWLDQTDDPASKVRDFARWVRDRGVGAGADVAFMKLGYVDILADTDLAGVFAQYSDTLAGLERDYPEVALLHVTVTPTRWDPANNAAIESYNELLRAAYGGSGRLVDLAAALSTCADGSVDADVTNDGRPYVRLCEEYSSDGGHVNEAGAEVAATALLAVLARVAVAP